MPRARNKKPPTGTPINFGHPTSKGLIGAWLFNENAGNGIFDRVRNKHATLTNGPIWGQGISGPCVSFDGTNDYAVTPVISFGGAQIITIAFRANLPTPAGTGVIFESSSDYNGSSDTLGCFIDATSFQFSIHGAVGYLVKTFALATAGWHNYVVQIDHSTTNGNIRFWIDGVEQAVVLTPFNGLTAAAAFSDYTFNMMARGAGTFPTGGKLDSVAIFGRALTTAEITRLAAEPYSFMRQPTRKKLTAAAALTAKFGLCINGLLFNGL